MIPARWLHNSRTLPVRIIHPQLTSRRRLLLYNPRDVAASPSGLRLDAPGLLAVDRRACLRRLRLQDSRSDGQAAQPAAVVPRPIALRLDRREPRRRGSHAKPRQAQRSRGAVQQGRLRLAAVRPLARLPGLGQGIRPHRRARQQRQLPGRADDLLLAVARSRLSRDGLRQARSAQARAFVGRRRPAPAAGVGLLRGHRLRRQMGRAALGGRTTLLPLHGFPARKRPRRDPLRRLPPPPRSRLLRRDLPDAAARPRLLRQLDRRAGPAAAARGSRPTSLGTWR